MRKLLKAGLVIMLVVGAPRIVAAGEEEYSSGREGQAIYEVRKILEREYDLKPRYIKGQKRYYRLWMTMENLDKYGGVAVRYQWRGDFERVVVSVDPSGGAKEKITWKNVGFRNWLNNEARYGSHQVAPWAEDFSYTFSLEDDYADLNNWDFSGIPKNSMGVVFRGALQITAHAEFDFLRSSRHATIERLRQVGQVLRSLPEEGKIFSLDFPPLFTNSRLERKHVRVGFLGLTLANGEPCALLDYQQGPQQFSWTWTAGAPGSGQPILNTDYTSRQTGVFAVRLEDGSLVRAHLAEFSHSKTTPAAGGPPTPGYTYGIWHIREITAEEYKEGLDKWAEEQTATPRFRPEVTMDKTPLGEEGGIR